VAEPITLGNARLTQTVSIGIATWNGRESPESLQKRADEAMYYAKQTGRNRVELARERKTRPKANGKPVARTR
jgi:diguanylate cyclase (GGDEF)-like protein